MPDREEKIRARAYSLWEREGYAHGGHERHWADAERQIAAEEAEAAPPAAPRSPKRVQKSGGAVATGAPKPPKSSRTRTPKPM